MYQVSNKMDNLLNNYIKNLPTDIKKEIFYFIIPSSLHIIFKRNNRKNIMNNRNYDPSIPRHYYSNINISDKYEVALLEDSVDYYEDGDIIPNKLYLFRIPKKNGKHRYYITEMIWYQVLEEDSDYRPVYRSDYKYISKYIGKNIDYALLLLMTDQDILNEEINKHLLFIEDRNNK